MLAHVAGRTFRSVLGVDVRWYAGGSGTPPEPGRYPPGPTHHRRAETAALAQHVRKKGESVRRTLTAALCAGATLGAVVLAVPLATASTSTGTAATTGSDAPHTLGVGGVATPPDAILVPDQDSTYTITKGGTKDDPEVYDCEGNTVEGGIEIDADNVVVQNCYVDAQQQYGIYSDGDNVTIRNNDIKGVRVSGDGDLNAITFFGNGTKILNNTAVDFVEGDPGDSHTDFVQTWVSDSHPTASDDVEIRGNRAIGPDNPDRDNDVPSIHQFVMAEDYGQGGNEGGDDDGMENWIIADNEIGDSWNQAIKLDGPDNVAITRNHFAGSSDKVMEVTDASSDVVFYEDNEVGDGYDRIGMDVTEGEGPE